MKRKVYGRQINSNTEFELLITSEGVNTSNKKNLDHLKDCST